MRTSGDTTEQKRHTEKSNSRTAQQILGQTGVRSTEKRGTRRPRARGCVSAPTQRTEPSRAKPVRVQPPPPAPGRAGHQSGKGKQPPEEPQQRLSTLAVQPPPGPLRVQGCPPPHPPPRAPGVWRGGGPRAGSPCGRRAPAARAWPAARPAGRPRCGSGCSSRCRGVCAPTPCTGP